jgi:hypothetical protein
MFYSICPDRRATHQFDTYDASRMPTRRYLILLAFFLNWLSRERFHGFKLADAPAEIAMLEKWLTLG